MGALSQRQLPTLEDVQRELAKKSLIHFMEYDGKGAWVRSQHLELLCSKLEAVARGELKRLMIYMPPRHGKSEVGSKKFPSWYLMNNPEKEIILSCYSADLANDFSKVNRSTIKEHQRMFDVKMNGAVERWGFEGKRGGFVSAGVGGAVTGRGAHIFIIDDPFKNWQDAASETIRQTVVDWYKTTAITRLSPDGAIVLIMTRWHEDDLAGQLIREMQDGGEQWDIVTLPAVAEENDILGRPVGQTLWPSRFPDEYYKDRKIAMGSRFWSALYQQHPTPAAGIIFQRHWLKFWAYQPGPGVDMVLPAKFDQLLQSWDCTFKDTKTSDYVVGQVWGRKSANRFLLDQVRGQMDIVDTIRSIEQLTVKWPRAAQKLIEDKANGSAVMQLLKNKIPGLTPVEPEGGKVVRAQAFAPYVESGNVYFPHPSIAPWVGDLVEEFCSFPFGKNDDQVDSASQANAKFQGDSNYDVGAMT